MRILMAHSRTLAVGLVFALAGFCYAVSNTAIETLHSNAEIRSVGSGITLRFTNPLVSSTTEYDLGDASFAGTIVRYVTAEGGIRPFRFTSDGSLSLANAIEGTFSSLDLGLSGVLAGTLSNTISSASKTVTGAPGFRFQVRVQDARGNSSDSATGTFNLFLVNSANQFRFAIDKLPDARLAATYVSRVEVIGGKFPLVFSLVSVANASTGATSTPESLGLFLSSDGTLMGRPLATGTFSLKIRCTDVSGSIAKNRANSTSDGTFTVIIKDSPVTSTDNLTTACNVRGGIGTVGADMLRYSGYINVLGQDNFNLLNSAFSFRLSGIGISGQLDKKGMLAQNLSDGSKVKVKVSAKSGRIDVSISKGSFSNALTATALVDGVNTRKALQVTVGDAVVSSEVLDFDTRTSGDKYTLDFKLGRNGSSAAGAFQIVSVKGKDDTTSGGLPGDAWRVMFIAEPRSGITAAGGLSQGLDNVTSATVRIGQSFSQNLLGATVEAAGNKLSFHGDRSSGVKRLTLDARRFTGHLETNVLSTKSTGIPQASQSPAFGNIFFQLGVDLVRGTFGTPFSGEHARRIFGLKNQFKDAPPGR